jgi:hypothetical protein
MSNLHVLALILGLIPLQFLTYHLIDRWFNSLTHVIATGVERGVPIALWHRRLLLNLSWLCGAVVIQISFNGIMAIVWTLLGRNVASEELKLLAYLCVFSSLMASMGWIVLIPFWYSRLARVLRQTEAD